MCHRMQMTSWAAHPHWLLLPQLLPHPLCSLWLSYCFENMQNMIHLQAFVYSVILTWMLCPQISSDLLLPRILVLFKHQACRFRAPFPDCLTVVLRYIHFSLLWITFHYYPRCHFLIELTRETITHTYSFIYLLPPLRMYFTEAWNLHAWLTSVCAVYLVHLLNEWMK